MLGVFEGGGGGVGGAVRGRVKKRCATYLVF